MLGTDVALQRVGGAEHGGVVGVPKDGLLLGRAVTLDEGMRGGTAV